MGEVPLFPEYSIGAALPADLRRQNPWWEGRPLPPLPSTRRHLVAQMHKSMERRLAPITAVRGPRQIGKTTAQLHCLQDLLASGVPARHICRVQFDDLPELARHSEPLLRVVDWYERNVLGATLNEVAHAGKRAYLFLDEVQNLANWAPQLKSLVDSSAVNVLVTGSSALRIELGRDSLAGRVRTLEAGCLTLTEIANFRGLDVGPPRLGENGLERLTTIEFWRELSRLPEEYVVPVERAFQEFSARGGYPLAHERADVPWSDLSDQLNETVIRRVIQHDLRVGERGRKRDALLLEEVFRMACRYAGQAPRAVTLAQEAQQALAANVGPQRIAHYLKFLADSLLLRLVEPLEIRLKRRRGSPKICLVDHGLRASWLQETIPLTVDGLRERPELTTLAGHLAESVVGATLSLISGLGLSYFAERKGEPEVDFVLTVGTRRIPVEVKYQRRIDGIRDTQGLRSFLEKTANHAEFGLLVTQTPLDVADPRIIVLPLPVLMLLR